MSPGTCKHFNGVQNKVCRRGVAYEVNWPMQPKPCIQFIEKSARGGTYIRAGETPAERKPFPGADRAKPCPFYEAPTTEEVEADRRESDAHFEKAMTAIKVASAWRVKPKPVADRHEAIECPICKGRLHLSQSAYNGHVHGKCETEGCVSWME